MRRLVFAVSAVALLQPTLGFSEESEPSIMTYKITTDTPVEEFGAFCELLRAEAGDRYVDSLRVRVEGVRSDGSGSTTIEGPCPPGGTPARTKAATGRRVQQSRARR